MGVALVFWLLFLGFLAWTWFGHRPSVDRFVTRHGIAVSNRDLPCVDRALHRSYRGRVVGALLGALLGTVALTAGAGFAAVGAFVGLVSGSMVGVALAQRRTRRNPEVVRRASLDARTIGGYTTRRGAWWITAAAGGCLVVPLLVVATAPAGLGPFGPALLGAIAAVLIVPVGVFLQRHIVEAPRDGLEPHVDDVLRSTAVRAVHHSVLGVLLCGLTVASFAGGMTTIRDSVLGDRGIPFAFVPATPVPLDPGQIRADHLRGPIRVHWTDADGTDHVSEPFYVARERPDRAGGSWVSLLLFGSALAAAIVALVQWWRATTSWRRPAARRGGGTTVDTAPVPA